MNQELKQRIIDLLDEHRIMTIAVNRADGWPQATVVGYANDGLFIYALIARAGQKWANILLDPRVSISIARDYPDPLQIRGLSMAARAAEVTDPAERERVGAIFLKRYPEYKTMPSPAPAEMPLVRFTPEIVSILDYSKGFGHTDLVRTADVNLPEVIDSPHTHWSLVASH
jgi:nitroimidazol reductase NimA-like FMN-containing flavoprotein (pyridoxamine 5'-phosphate oxidase superfamily)